MKQPEHVRAARLLKLREERAAFPRRYLFRSKTLLPTILIIGALVAWTMIEPVGIASNRAIWLLAGLLVGRIIRDFIWLRDIVDSFTFTEKVLDWDKVTELANKQESNNSA